jgi:hypothetical protein
VEALNSCRYTASTGLANSAIIESPVAPKDPPMIRSYTLIRNRSAGLQITERPVFVFTHHPTETDNVRSEDSR